MTWAGAKRPPATAASRVVIDLASRDREVRELMDDPDADLAALRRTYRQFRLVNRLVAGWGRLYGRDIRPLLSTDREATLLDIGSGGGDVARAMARPPGWRCTTT
jgi:2-polyprenyl-3-methyl-5-hydroxy-6-metoxy-1,4-benzoquinol methylase